MKPAYLFLPYTVAERYTMSKWHLKIKVAIFWNILSLPLKIQMFRPSEKLIVMPQTPGCPWCNFIDYYFAFLLLFFFCTIWSCRHCAYLKNSYIPHNHKSIKNISYLIRSPFYQDNNLKYIFLDKSVSRKSGLTRVTFPLQVLRKRRRCLRQPHTDQITVNLLRI